MSNQQIELKNCLILLMGFPGVGKRSTGEIFSKKTHFKLAHHHDWVDPILKLLGDDYQVMWNLDAAGWEKLNAMDDIILSTIADVCEKESSFIITQAMFDQDPYHQIFYDKVFAIAKKRNAHFFPVRLVCDENELAKRVQSEDRKKYFKTRDVNLSKKRSNENQVFYSNHKNEITFNNTNLSAEIVSDRIIEHIMKKTQSV
ncbi:MAG: hypothetical protein NTZ67_08305 [Gammaproteobacteria bacterium]|nr:hypothetical protein [Gammaproteobacteria bacterium]